MAILDFKNFSCGETFLNRRICSLNDTYWYIWKQAGPQYMLKPSYHWRDGVAQNFVGSNIANFLIPGRAPEVSLVKDYESNIVYSASKWLPTFEEGYGTGYRETGIVSQLLLHCDQHHGNLGRITTPEGIKYSAIVDFDTSLGNDKYHNCQDYKNHNRVIGVHIRTLIIPHMDGEVQDESEKIINFINNKKEEITALFKGLYNDLKESGIDYSDHERLFWNRVELLSNELNMDRALTALFSDVTSSAFEEKYQDSLEPCVLLDHAQHALDGRVFSHDLFSLMTEEKFKFIASYLGKCTEKRFSDIYEFDYQVRFSFVLGAARCWSDKQFIINNFRKILPYIHDRPSVIKYIESSGSNGYYRELLQANTEYERELKAQSYSNSESEHGQVIGNSHNILDEL